MFRRAAPVAFAAAVVTVAACGHQVTPSLNATSNNNLSGRMLLRFRTKAAMDFTNYDYFVVVNTCATGNSNTPLPNVYGSTFLNYSYSLSVGASSGGVSTTSPYLQQYILTQSSTNPLNPQYVPVNPSLTTLELNDNGSNNEFQLIFTRSQLDNPKGVAQVCPNIAASAAPTATASATVSPTASAGASPTATPTLAAGATATPTATATASPTATAVAPNPAGTLYSQHYWYFNFLVLDHRTGQPVDSLGIGGATDTTYNAQPIDTTSTNTYTVNKQPDVAPPSAGAAQIDGGEIDNYQ